MITLNENTNSVPLDSQAQSHGLSKVHGQAYPYWRELIRNGDWLLWRPTSWAGKLICRFTEQEYSHVSMAAWVLHDDDTEHLYNVEMIQFRGGRRTRLSKEIAQYPGMCDVYRPKDQYIDQKDGTKKRARYNGKNAAYQMLFLMSRPYGWLDFFYLAARILLGMTFPERQKDSNDPDVPRVCSAAVSYAARVGGGIDVTAAFPDALTTPGMFANPEVARYITTLYPEEVEAA